MFLKCPAAPLRHEISLTCALAERLPHRVTAPLAHDVDDSWICFADGGRILRERNLEDGFSWASWEALAREAGQLQVEAAASVEVWLEAGCPDTRFARLPELLAELAERYRERLGAETADRIRRTALEPLIEPLAALGVPDSILHNDLHDLNAFVTPDGPRIFDWGDAVVGFPLLDAAVLLDSAARQGKVPSAAGRSPEIARVFDAYLEPWTSFATARELRSVEGKLRRLATIGRAVAWDTIDAVMDAGDRERFGDRVVHWLSALVEDPMGGA